MPLVMFLCDRHSVLCLYTSFHFLLSLCTYFPLYLQRKTNRKCSKTWAPMQSASAWPNSCLPTALSGCSLRDIIRKGGLCWVVEEQWSPSAAYFNFWSQPNWKCVQQCLATDWQTLIIYFQRFFFIIFFNLNVEGVTASYKHTIPTLPVSSSFIPFYLNALVLSPTVPLLWFCFLCSPPVFFSEKGLMNPLHTPYPANSTQTQSVAGIEKYLQQRIRLFLRIL